MALRRIFGPERDEVIGEWRKLQNEGLNDLYCSHYIVRVIKSRRMRWAGHVTHETLEEYTGFWWRNLRERDHLGDPGVDGKIILRWIFQEVGCGSLDWIELAQDTNRCRAIVNAVINTRSP